MLHKHVIYDGVNYTDPATAYKVGHGSGRHK